MAIESLQINHYQAQGKTMTTPIRVMLVEDNVEYRNVVALALDSAPDIELISQFGTAEIALRTMGQENAQKPNLILLDIRLPGMDGLDALPKFCESVPDSKIIILTQSNHEQDVLKAISAGAAGYLLKSATLEELIEGIREVAGGGATLDSGVAKFILETLQTNLPPEQRAGILSAREMEVLTLLAEGLVKKEIAKQLEIGYSTVDTHVGRIYAKLGVSNAPSAVNRAHRLNLFPPS